jgi:glycerophosphoryl diester phosphodiesterase
MPHRVLIAGHRGYFAKEIENTLAAFKRAIREKVHFAEFDIMRTRDNVPIVFHDLMVNRLLNGTGYVRQFTLGELKRLEYKDGQKILTLEEFFQETRGRIRPLLEIKSKGLEAEILSLVRKYNVEKDIIIQSFKAGALRRCMALRPDLAYALNVGPIFKLGFLGDVSRLHELTARMTYFRMLRHLPVSFIHPDGPYVYNAFIDLARARGKRIMVGAIRTQNYITKIVDWGIEVLCCNDPGDIREKIKLHWGNEVICD